MLIVRLLSTGALAGLLIASCFSVLLGSALLLQWLAPSELHLATPIGSAVAGRLIAAYVGGGLVTGISWMLLRPWRGRIGRATLLGSAAAFPFFAAVYGITHSPLTWGYADTLLLTLMSVLGGWLAGGRSWRWIQRRRAPAAFGQRP